jgi:ABC-2 type transport system ATP-binding protein
MAMIVTADLTKRYPGVTALQDLTLDVEPGIVGLVGANGAGKSTLIKILLGLLPPTSGTAQVLGRDVLRQGAEIRQRVGYMPEHDCLPPDVSATELVVHLARISGLPATAARERAADTLRHVGLYEERYRPIGGYSTGMRQRVKLAQALAHDPSLVLLDEPTNGLDPAGRTEMLELVRRVGTEFGISVLVTSHQLGEIERICDHVVVIDGGRLLRSSAIGAFLERSPALAVEVTDGADRLAQELTDRGQKATSDGRTLLVELRDETTYDLIRDAIAELGLGLVRIEQRRHHIEDLFRPDAVEPQEEPRTEVLTA